jgi:GMP synthase-like glutamine amidotransferase
VARALVVQHTAGEGLGWLQEWWPAFGLDVHPIHPYLGHRVPPLVEGDALVVLGGPMGAYDDEAAPWLPSVRDLLATAVDDGVPTMGICLGAQLLAVACGGEVQKGVEGPELGVDEVQVDAGDALLEAGVLPVVQWHYDTVTRLPEGSVNLASSARYPVQAFRVGELAWGVQFHLEATQAMVTEWAHEDADALRGEGRTPDDVAASVGEAQFRLRSAGERLAERFAKLVTG